MHIPVDLADSALWRYFSIPPASYNVLLRCLHNAITYDSELLCGLGDLVLGGLGGLGDLIIPGNFLPFGNFGVHTERRGMLTERGVVIRLIRLGEEKKNICLMTDGWFKGLKIL